MSQFLQTNPTKRSTSLCLDTPLNQSDAYYSHQIDQHNRPFDKTSTENMTIFTESIPSTSNNLLTPQSHIQTSVSPTSIDVERLSIITYQLKQENRELTSKLEEMNEFQQRIFELEAQNKQLQKELNLKDNSPSKRNSSPNIRQSASNLNKSFEKTKGTPSKSIGRTSQSPIREPPSQTKALNTEIRKLKSQVEILKQENKDLEDKVVRFEELEAEVEEAKVQMEFLNDELESKDFELRGLREEVVRLSEQKDRFENLLKENENAIEQIQQQLQESGKDKEHELSSENNNRQVSDSQILKEDLIFLQDLSEQLLKKLTFCEEETKILKDKTLEKDFEIENLRNQIEKAEAEKAIELEMDKDLDGISKGFWQETVNQMLLEKANYKVKVIELESQIDILKQNHEKAISDLEEKMRQTEREVRKTKGEKNQIESEMGKEIGRLRIELATTPKSDIGMQTQSPANFSRSEESPFTENDNKEIEALKNKLALKEQELAKEKEKYKENMAISEKSMRFLKESNERNEENRKRLEENMKLLESELGSNKQRVQDMQSQMVLLTERNQTLHTLCQEFESERNENNKTMEEYLFREEESVLELAELKQQTLDDKEMIIKHASEKRRQEHEIGHLKASIEEFKEELNSLYQALAQRKEDCAALVKQNEQLKKENLQLKKISGSKNTEKSFISQTGESFLDQE